MYLRVFLSVVFHEFDSQIGTNHGTDGATGAFLEIQYLSSPISLDSRQRLERKIQSHRFFEKIFKKRKRSD